MSKQLRLPSMVQRMDRFFSHRCHILKARKKGKRRRNNKTRTLSSGEMKFAYFTTPKLHHTCIFFSLKTNLQTPHSPSQSLPLAFLLPVPHGPVIKIHKKCFCFFPQKKNLSVVKKPFFSVYSKRK